MPLRILLALVFCLSAGAQTLVINTRGSSGGGTSVIPAILLVSHTAAGSVGSLTVTTPAINTTGADLICVYVALDTGTGTVVSDSAGNTYTALTSHGAAFPQRGVVFYVLNPTTSATHTWTFSGNGQSPAIAVQAFSGVTGYLADTGNSITSAAASIQTGTVSPTLAGSLVVTGLGWDTAATASIDSSFTVTDSVAFSGSNHYAAAMAYLLTNTAANPTWTISASSADGLGTSIAAFTPKRSPPTPPYVIR